MVLDLRRDNRQGNTPRQVRGGNMTPKMDFPSPDHDGHCQGQPEGPSAKVWGSSQRLHLDRHSELARLVIRRGGYCSLHRHRGKANAFLVVQGRLLVMWYRNGRRRHRRLAAGDGLWTVPAEVEHRFLALEEPTVAYEFYYSVHGRPLDPADIVRRDEGGVLPHAPQQVMAAGPDRSAGEQRAENGPAADPARRF